MAETQELAVEVDALKTIEHHWQFPARFHHVKYLLGNRNIGRDTYDVKPAECTDASYGEPEGTRR